MADKLQAPAQGRDYKDTLSLPQTDFPMRAGLPKAEPKWLAHWREMNLYQKLRDDAAERTPFILHDGPPYANGHLHIGHALNKVLKDIIVRARQMSGFNANYIPGWDCHGLPIEWQVEKHFKEKGRRKQDVPAAEFRSACREYAAKWIDIQRQEFQRLGIEGDWANPYVTMDFTSEASIAGELLKFAERGLLFRGTKPVMWSPVEQTALAEAEIEYHDHQSTTIWVKFPVTGPVAGEASNPDHPCHGAAIVIWTTTPWTIPGNRAICYGPDLSYGLYEVDKMKADLDFAPWSKPGDRLIVADKLAESVREAGLIEKWTRVSDIGHELLQDLHCEHPLRGFAGGYEFTVPLLSGDHVTDEAGTGFVHTAPGHGQEDYFAWLDHKLPQEDIPYTVGPDGAYTDEAPGFTGEKVIVTEGKKTGRDGGANKAVLAQLIAQGSLLARGRLTHSYPHSWRSKAPVIFRNTPQWFIRLDQPMKRAVSDQSTDSLQNENGATLREIALDAIERTAFYPETGRNRIRTMVEGRPDWLVSRQRAWGVPITIFAHKETGDPLNDRAVNERIISAIAERGADAWFDTPAQVFLGDQYKAEDYDKVEDILDVWFDSGSSHAFTLEARAAELGLEDRLAKNEPLADLYLEGSDQHRGWFQSSLLEASGTRERAPFKAVLTHGFVMDEKNRKMSKSLGNVTDPADVMQQYGADILRIWVASSDYSDDLRISKEVTGSAVDGYRKLRNTLRYLLGAVSDYTDDQAVDLAQMPGLERYVLHLLHTLDGQVRAAFEAYDFKTVWRRVFDFCAADLSSLYLDIRKDSLYCDDPDNIKRRAARTVMAIVLDHIMRWLAPICVFTMEEVFTCRYGTDAGKSIHLEQFLPVDDAWKNEALAAQWQKIRDVRRVVTGALEIERREKRIGSSLAAAPIVYLANKELYDLCTGQDMAEISITSALTLTTDPAPADAFRLEDAAPEEGQTIAALPKLATGEKCSRCWRILPEVTAQGELCNRCAPVVAKHDRQSA